MESKNNKYMLDVLLILLGGVPVVVSAGISSSLGEWEWFQRSGSLLVLFSVALEYRQSQLAQPVRSTSMFIEGRPAAMGYELPRIRKWMYRYAITAIVLGTLMWGYGDLVGYLVAGIT